MLKISKSYKFYFCLLGICFAISACMTSSTTTQTPLDDTSGSGGRRRNLPPPDPIEVKANALKQSLNFQEIIEFLKEGTPEEKKMKAQALIKAGAYEQSLFTKVFADQKRTPDDALVMIEAIKTAFADDHEFKRALTEAKNHFGNVLEHLIAAGKDYNADETLQSRVTKIKYLLDQGLKIEKENDFFGGRYNAEAVAIEKKLSAENAITKQRLAYEQAQTDDAEKKKQDADKLRVESYKPKLLAKLDNQAELLKLLNTPFDDERNQLETIYQSLDDAGKTKLRNGYIAYLSAQLNTKRINDIAVAKFWWNDFKPQELTLFLNEEPDDVFGFTQLQLFLGKQKATHGIADDKWDELLKPLVQELFGKFNASENKYLGTQPNFSTNLVTPENVKVDLARFKNKEIKLVDFKNTVDQATQFCDENENKKVNCKSYIISYLPTYPGFSIFMNAANDKNDIDIALKLIRPANHKIAAAGYLHDFAVDDTSTKDIKLVKYAIEKSKISMDELGNFFTDDSVFKLVVNRYKFNDKAALHGYLASPDEEIDPKYLKPTN